MEMHNLISEYISLCFIHTAFAPVDISIKSYLSIIRVFIKNQTSQSLQVSFFNILPVNNLPDMVNIIRSDIFVLDVISMFPDINAQKRNKTNWNQWVLIRHFLKDKTLISLIVTKPSPTGALNPNSFLGQLRDEVFIGSKISQHLLSKFRIISWKDTTTLLDGG